MSKEPQCVTITMVKQLLELLPGGGAKRLHETVHVLCADLKWLISKVDVLPRVGLPLRANVTTTTEWADCDYIRVKAVRNVAGESTIKATLQGERERGEGENNKTVSPW